MSKTYRRGNQGDENQRILRRKSHSLRLRKKSFKEVKFGRNSIGKGLQVKNRLLRGF